MSAVPGSGATGPAIVDAASLSDLLSADRGPRVLDVRTPGEFETGHIPGAYNVPLDLLREHRSELRTHLDDKVVLVCRSGARAVQAEQSLGAAGLPNVMVLDGGMMAWQASGGPVNRRRQRWDLERQVRLVVGVIVLMSILGSLLVPGLEWIAALLGAGLTVAALTNTCALGMLLARLPYNRGASCDLDTIVGQLREAPPATGSRA
jgi:rhodanese-related sulfurtransferase